MPKWTPIFHKTALVGLIASTIALIAGEPQPPFPEIASPEIWADGPEMAQIGTQVEFPGIAVDDLGRRIYAWSARGGALEADDILLRRFDAEGNPETNPFVINTYTTNAQKRPRIAPAADGSFLVVWDSQERNLADTADRTWVRGQAFNADGNSVGSELLISTLSPEVPTEASSDVAALREPDGSHGGYVVVWESRLSNGDDSSPASIQARFVGADGAPIGAQFQVNTNTQGSQTEPAVAELADGGFLIVFEQRNPDLVLGRRYDSTGVPIGNDFTISTEFTSTKQRPDVAIGWDGRVAVVWEDDEVPGEGTEIRARLFDPVIDPAGPDPAMNPAGPDFRVNTLTLETQSYPSVADYGSMGFLVTWHSTTSVGNDNDQTSVQARLMTGHDSFDYDGDGIDDEQVQYNTWTDTHQRFAHSAGWYGRLGSTWRSNGHADAPSDPVVTGRDIEYCLFCDDFEWGTWRWTRVEGQARSEKTVLADR